MEIIIKSKGRNWSGKEFSALPAKIYDSFEAGVSALLSYHFFKYDKAKSDFIEVEKFNEITFIPLSEKRRQKLLHEKKIRY